MSSESESLDQRQPLIVDRVAAQQARMGQPRRTAKSWRSNQGGGGTPPRPAQGIVQARPGRRDPAIQVGIGKNLPGNGKSHDNR